MSEKMPRSEVIEGHVGNSRSHEQRIQYDDCASSPAFRSLVLDIMDWSGAPSSKRHELEGLLRRSMKQEGGFPSSEQMLLNSDKRNSGSQINETGPRSLHLKFLNKVGESIIFTGVPIKGENCQPLKVALVDGQSGDFVTVGPEASARVEIVALDQECGGCLGDSWTPEEFKNNIVTKEGNKRLLTGNVVLDLQGGIGYAGIFQFSHTKNWMPQRAFRLGVIAMDDYVRTIREGFTDSFIVQDHRLDLNKKHHPPNLYDEVWRLDGISKGGAFHKRLRDKEVNINTVEDLLKKLNTDPKKLRDILGKSMSAKMWETLVKHAQECMGDVTPCLYSSSDCLRETSKLFNMVGQERGLISESQYVSSELLSEPEKVHAMNIVVPEFQQWDKVVPLNDLPQPATSFEDKPSMFDESPVLVNIFCPPKSPTMESPSSSKMINFPKYCELGFPNPAVPLDDKEPLFDESLNQNIINFPPKSPVIESSGATMALISQENNELDFPPSAFSLDEAAILFGEPPGPSTAICSPKLDLSQPFPSHEISTSWDSVWEMSYYNDCYSQCADLENTVHGHLSYSSQMTDSDNWEMVSMDQSFREENLEIPLQFSVDDVPLDTIELRNYPKIDGNNARKRYLRNKAKKKWRILFSVVKWLFVPRKLPLEHISSSYQDSQALDIVNSGHIDFAKPTFDKSKSLQIFDSPLSTNSEALHKAVNDMLLARSFAIATNIEKKKYMSKREKAQRRWTKLYSVMKWFLVQRKVAKKASSALTLRRPSCSSSLDDMSPNENTFLQLFNKFCSLQPRNRIAMNKLAWRRNVSDRDFAKKKWRMLFSIMKWLSVRRNAAKVKRPYNNS